MKASVVITTYRRSGCLVKAIQSALSQDCDDYEIIVVDDNGYSSSYYDCNKELMVQFSNNKKVRYLPLEINQGACNARNQGAAVANGEYVFFLDDDDEFLSNKISYQAKFLDDHPEYIAHLCSMNRIEKDGRLIASKENTPRGTDFVSFAIDGNFFTTMMAIRKSVFLAVNGFDDIPRFQDKYFMLKLLNFGYSVRMDEAILFTMHEHINERITNTSMRNSLIALNMLTNLKEAFRYRFSNSDWEKVELNNAYLKASIFHQSKIYSDHLKALLIYLRLFLMNPSKDLLFNSLRCIIPVFVIEKYHQLF